MRRAGVDCHAAAGRQTHGVDYSRGASDRLPERIDLRGLCSFQALPIDRNETVAERTINQPVEQFRSWGVDV